MTDQVWRRVGHIAAAIDELHRDLERAEADRNYGLARIVGEQIRAAESVRDRLLSQVGGELSYASA